MIVNRIVFYGGIEILPPESAKCFICKIEEGSLIVSLSPVDTDEPEGEPQQTPEEGEPEIPDEIQSQQASDLEEAKEPEGETQQTTEDGEAMSSEIDDKEQPAPDDEEASFLFISGDNRRKMKRKLFDVDAKGDEAKFIAELFSILAKKPDMNFSVLDGEPSMLSDGSIVFTAKRHAPVTLTVGEWQEIIKELQLEIGTYDEIFSYAGYKYLREEWSFKEVESFFSTGRLFTRYGKLAVIGGEADHPFRIQTIRAENLLEGIHPFIVSR